ncbi:MAG TPA: cupin domain-containing protein [Azospirillum sp.]|nr:cupin domain-containing protein [Azospirillum sp.]
MANTIVRLDDARLSDTDGTSAVFGVILSGAPLERCLTLFDDRTRRFACGVWECTGGVVQMEEWPQDEFCVLLAGRVIITPEGGQPQEFRQGDALAIPRGFTGTWDIREPVRKYFAIQRPSLRQRIVRRARDEIRGGFFGKVFRLWRSEKGTPAPTLRRN